MKYFTLLCALCFATPIISGPKKKSVTGKPEIKIEKVEAAEAPTMPQAIPLIPAGTPTPYPSPSQTFCIIGPALPSSEEIPTATLEDLLAKEFKRRQTDRASSSASDEDIPKDVVFAEETSSASGEDSQKEEEGWQDQIEYMFEHSEE